jgi:hypothetical protein
MLALLPFSTKPPKIVFSFGRRTCRVAQEDVSVRRPTLKAYIFGGKDLPPQVNFPIIISKSVT